MKIHGYSKPVKLFRIYNKGGWRERNIVYEELSSGTSIACINKDDIVELTKTKREFDSKHFGKLTPNATLFFDKSATFPRYKLEGSGFKRCIKKEKADFIIVGKTSPKTLYRNHINVYEDNNYLYVTGYCSYTDNEINNAMLGAGINPRRIYSDYAYVYPPASQLLLDPSPFKPLIYDTDLDAYINKTLPKITESDVKQIQIMLNSNERSTIDLGLKTLASYDVTGMAMTTKVLLLMNPNWVHSDAAKSVGVDTMLTSLGLTRQSCSYVNLNSKLNLINENKTPYTDEDKKLAKSLIKDWLVESVEKAVSPYRKTFETESYGFKINVNVED